jgi:hypothetical protein
LVIPRRKTSLCEALHGRAAIAGVGAPWPAMGSSPEGKGKWERRRRERGHSQGAAWGLLGVAWGGLLGAARP